MSKNQQYAEQYADFAMEQMRKYGIPASVTLAQGILESSNGQSCLALNENNHFGIKATPGWIANGGKYGLYTDDKPDEKFCSYDSVGDSYEHHSKFLIENKRYDGCFALAPDDYKGWTEGLAKAGYASGGNYAQSLQKIIETNGLQKYDQIVMAEMKAQGLEIGQEKNANANGKAYSFPVGREEFLFVTSPFGMRTDPMDPTKQQMHKALTSVVKGMRYWQPRTMARWWLSTTMPILPEESPSPLNTKGMTEAGCRTPICTCLLSMSRQAMLFKPGKKSEYPATQAHAPQVSICISG